MNPSATTPAKHTSPPQDGDARAAPATRQRDPPQVPPAKRSSVEQGPVVSSPNERHAAGTLTLSQQQIMDFAAANPTMTMAELIAQQRGDAAGASPFHLTNGTPVLLLANVATTDAPTGARPPTIMAVPATAPPLAAMTAPPTPAEPIPNINAFTQDDEEMTQYYATNNSAHTSNKQDDASAARVTNQNPIAISGRARVLTNLFNGFNWFVAEPVCIFRIQYNYKEEHKRIHRAVMPDAINENAEAIAEQVNGERSLPPRNTRAGAGASSQSQ